MPVVVTFIVLLEKIIVSFIFYRGEAKNNNKNII